MVTFFVKSVFKFRSSEEWGLRKVYYLENIYAVSHSVKFSLLDAFILILLLCNYCFEKKELVFSFLSVSVLEDGIHSFT